MKCIEQWVAMREEVTATIVKLTDSLFSIEEHITNCECCSKVIENLPAADSVATTVTQFLS